MLYFYMFLKMNYIHIKSDQYLSIISNNDYTIFIKLDLHIV